MTEQSGWIPTRTGALWSGLHQPDGGVTGRAVVIVPPFGWEGMSCGRQLRAWARDLAASGHIAVRYQPPGEGDSEGLSDVQDLTSWSTALVDVVEHTRSLAGVRRVTVLALGLGVPVALAAAADAPVDELVLWAGQGRGRPMLRELRAFAAMTNVSDNDTTGTLWVTGHPLGASAQEQLGGFDATALDLSRLSRVLMLGRASLPTDGKLAASLESQGVTVVREPGPGYDELTVEPRLSAAPTQVRSRVARWLLEVPVTGEEVASPLPWPEAETAESVHAVGPARVVVRQAPGATATAVLLSAGAVSRSGPNRFWTEAARRWSESGVSTVRVDLAGIGEADGPDTWERGPEGFYDPAYGLQIRDVLDRLAHWGLPKPVLTVGLCSGGYWAAQTALHDDRVRAVAMLNTYSLIWPPPLADLGVRGRVAHLSSWQTWRPLVRDAAARADAWGRVRRTWRDRRGRSADGDLPGSTVEVLERLDERGVIVMVGLSPGEVALPAVQSMPPSGLRHVYAFTGPEDAHTLSPPVLRRQTERALDATAALVSAQELVQR